MPVGKKCIYNTHIRSKHGVTLVELCIVLALFAITSAMIVTFSVSMNKYVGVITRQTDFLGDCTRARESIKNFVSSFDEIGTVVDINSDGMLTVNDGTTTREISFSEGVLLCGEKRLDGFTKVEKITFEKNSDMIKCILSRNDKNGNEEFSFVVSVRCASLASEKGGTR